VSATYDNFTFQTPAARHQCPQQLTVSFSQTDVNTTRSIAGKSRPAIASMVGNVGVAAFDGFGPIETQGEIKIIGQSASSSGFELIPVESQMSYAEGQAGLAVSPVSVRGTSTDLVNNVTIDGPEGKGV